MKTPAPPTRRSPRFSTTPKSQGRSQRDASPARASSAAKRSLGLSPTLSSQKVGSFVSSRKRKDRVYETRIEFEDEVFEVGDDVYVRRFEASAGCDESDEELEECKLCGKQGGEIMIECDSCLGGFHLTCLEPPLEAVPEGEWVCPKCEKKEIADGGGATEAPQKRHRTARERLLAKELWAARIERLWKEPDGSPWFSGCWYVIPEDTAAGRQPHHGRRELFRTNHVDQNEIASILRHCVIMTPEDFSRASNEGDDVFFCEYEYDVKWHTFKRIADLEEPTEEIVYEEESEKSEGDDSGGSRRKRKSATPNKTSRKKVHTEIFGLENLRRKVPADSRRHLSEIEKAKAALALSVTPEFLPCREKEKQEIEAFVTDALREGTDCLGKCLYISGVPGTGKTATVLDVMRAMEKKLDSKEVQPYRFVEINALRLVSPEQIYTILHEALTGQRLSWKRALQLLDERFSGGQSLKGVDGRPCILLVDELDLLVTRTQSVLYNLFDWPCRSNSRLTVIGIANTIDLPERLLPRIASRMGLQRVAFSPYSYTQLQQIINYRLSGVEAFEKTAVEFASRKVAAVSGDARRALELCRRAAELAECRQSMPSTEPVEEPPSKLIGMVDVETAINEMFQAPHVQVMRRCSKHAKIFLTAMVYEYLKTGMAETTFEEVADSHILLCSNNGEQPPNKDTLLSIGCRLGECRLLLCEPASKRRLQKLQLNFPSDDVSFALKDSPELPWIVKYLT